MQSAQGHRTRTGRGRGRGRGRSEKKTNGTSTTWPLRSPPLAVARCHFTSTITLELAFLDHCTLHGTRGRHGDRKPFSL